MSVVSSKETKRRQRLDEDLMKMRRMKNITFDGF